MLLIVLAYVPDKTEQALQSDGIRGKDSALFVSGWRDWIQQESSRYYAKQFGLMFCFQSIKILFGSGGSCHFSEQGLQAVGGSPSKFECIELLR